MLHKSPPEFICLLLESNLFIGSAAKKSANVMLSEALPAELPVLHRMHQFVKKDLARERLDVHHYILKRDACHLREAGCVCDPNTSQLSIERRPTRPSAHDFYRFQHLRGKNDCSADLGGGSIDEALARSEVLCSEIYAATQFASCRI